MLNITIEGRTSSVIACHIARVIAFNIVHRIRNKTVTNDILSKVANPPSPTPPLARYFEVPT